MIISIEPLPYGIDSLEPVISMLTMKTHFEKHYRSYIVKLNGLIPETEYQSLKLVDIVLRSRKSNPSKLEIDIFNNANQAWNHTFFWNGLTDRMENLPSAWLNKIISVHFGSLSDFKKKFGDIASGLFGSGWVWLVLNSEKKLEILPGPNASNPMTEGYIPLFVLDVWEHAYYLDYQSERRQYIEKIWDIANWDFIEKELRQSLDFVQVPKIARAVPRINLLRKSSVQGGALIGGIVGLVIFFFLALLVNLNFVHLPGLVSATGNDNKGWTLLIVGLFGIIFGAASGALVGIGTPAKEESTLLPSRFDQRTNLGK